MQPYFTPLILPNTDFPCLKADQVIKAKHTYSGEAAKRFVQISKGKVKVRILLSAGHEHVIRKVAFFLRAIDTRIDFSIMS